MIDWREFETIARGEALAMSANAPPLERGQYVAWTVQGDFGYTDHLSEKHLAYSDIVTYCGQAIPPRYRRLPVVYKTLKLCSRCALKHANVFGGLGADTR